MRRTPCGCDAVPYDRYAKCLHGRTESCAPTIRATKQTDKSEFVSFQRLLQYNWFNGRVNTPEQVGSPESQDP